MKFLVLAALFAAVASGPLSETTDNQQQWPWQAGYIYRYEVLSYTLARHEEGPSTGNAFKARFNIRVKSADRLQARLENPEHVKIHQDLPNNRELPTDLKYQSVENLDQPIEITVEGGRVLALSLPSSLPLSYENLLKGLISALQVDLSAHRNVHSSANKFDSQTFQGLYRKMETDVTGDCETLYTVSPVASEWRRELQHLGLKEEPIEITKSRTYGHCHHSVAYHFGIPEGAEWTGVAQKNNENQFVKRATVSRILAGKQGPIYKTETTSTVHVSPQMRGKQKTEVISYVSLRLVSSSKDTDAEWQKPEENRVVPSLMYSMTKKKVSAQAASAELIGQNNKERVKRSTKVISINKVFVRKRSDESQSDSSSSSDSGHINDEKLNINEPAYAAMYMNAQAHRDDKNTPINAQKLIQDIAQLLHTPSNMPKADFLTKFNILVRLIASMSSEQLAQVSRNIEAAKSSNDVVKVDMWMIYRDAVVQSGTLPAFKLIKKWILSKKIEGEEAAEVIATLANTLRYPTKDIMIQFYKLARSDEVSQQKYLNSTALIAATRFINMGQVNNQTAQNYYPTQMYGRLSRRSDPFVYEQILPSLSSSLREAIVKGDSHKAQVFIKSIGNLGHTAILAEFAPYLEGEIPVSTYLRTQMVGNLKVLAHQGDSSARAVLYSILRNTAEPYDVRVSAIQGVFLARPSSTMMQAMAQMTHDDPSVQVRSALTNAIESAAKITNPYYLELARTAQAAKNMVTKQKFGILYSKKNIIDEYDQEDEFGFLSAMSTIGSDDYRFPKFLRYSWRNSARGWNKESSVSAGFSSVRQFVDYILQSMNYLKENEQKATSNHKYSAEKISEMLNIKRDRRNMEAAFYIDLLNQQRFFTFGEEEIKQLPKVMKQYLLDLTKGKEMHYTKVLNANQVNIMFPLAMGMPFVYKYQEPTVIHVESKAKGSIKMPSGENKDFIGSFEKEIQFTFARNLDGKAGFLDTLSNHFASAGVVSKVQVNVPIKMFIVYKHGEMKLHLEPLRPDQETTVAHYSVWPYTANQNKDSLVPVSLDQTTKPISRRNKVVNIDNKLGLPPMFQLQGYSYSSDYKSWWNMFKSQGLFSNMVLSLQQRDIALTHFNLRYLGSKVQSKGVTFTATYDSLYNQKEAGQEDIIANELNDVTPNNEARRKELVKRVASGINSAQVKVLDLSATIEGPQKLEYILTAAIGDSPVDQKVRFAFFAARNNEQGNYQVNGIAKVTKPVVTAMDLTDTLNKELKMNYEADIRFGKTGNINVFGNAERSQKYTELLRNWPLSKLCMEQIATGNFYQPACHKTIVMAHAPDFTKASFAYKGLTTAMKLWSWRVYRIAEYLGWFYDGNFAPLMISEDGKFDMELRANYFDRLMNVKFNTKAGTWNTNVEIPRVAAGVFSLYSPMQAFERLNNYYTGHQYLPYCSVDGSWIRTFSNRTYEYPLSPSWHVVMQDDAWHNRNDQVAILSRRPSDKEQEVYISYKSRNGKDLEIEIKSSEGKPSVKVNTDSKKVSEGPLTMYWDDVQEVPLLQYYSLPDEVFFVDIRDSLLTLMFQNQRFVVLSRKNYRNTTRGVCGQMSGEFNDDFMTPYGLVDKPEYFAASYAINDENTDPKTKELQVQAKQNAYKRQYKYTNIHQSNDEWSNAMESSSSEEEVGSQSAYRARSYLKGGQCQLQYQVQFYENHGEICITTIKMPSCQSHCNNEGYKLEAAPVVCRPKLDQQFRTYRDQIRRGQNPKVSGMAHMKQYRVPSDCKA